MVNAVRRTDRNLEGVRGQALRERVDAWYWEYSSTLKTAYNQYWKYGLPKKWFKWDVRNTARANKKQFDILYGLLNHIYVVLMYSVNNRFNIIPWPILAKMMGGDNPLQRSRQWIVETANQYDLGLQEIKNHIRQWFIKNRKHDVDL